MEEERWGGGGWGEGGEGGEGKGRRGNGEVVVVWVRGAGVGWMRGVRM